MKMKDLDEQVSLEAEPDFGKFSQDDIMRSIGKKKDSADDDEAGQAKDLIKLQHRQDICLTHLVQTVATLKQLMAKIFQ